MSAEDILFYQAVAVAALWILLGLLKTRVRRKGLLRGHRRRERDYPQGEPAADPDPVPAPDDEDPTTSPPK